MDLAAATNLKKGSKISSRVVENSVVFAGHWVPGNEPAILDTARLYVKADQALHFYSLHSKWPTTSHFLSIKWFRSGPTNMDGF